jgi:PAS domain S-box-containing protein
MKSRRKKRKSITGTSKHQAKSKVIKKTGLQTEEKYLSILKELPDIVYKIDTDGRFTFVSNAIRILSYKPEELIGKHFSEIVHPDDVKLFSRYFVLPQYKGKTTGYERAPKLFDERRTGKRKTENLEIRLIPKKNRNKEPESLIGAVIAFGDVSSAGYYDNCMIKSEKKFLGTLGIIRNITESKQVEEKLHYQADLLQNVSDAIISTDLDFNICTWNRAAEKMYGWKAYEVVGKPLQKVTKSKYQHAKRNEVVEKILKQGHWRGKVIQSKKNGALINVLTSFSLVKDHLGNSTSIVVLNLDITERKLTEESIKQRTEELATVNALSTVVSQSLDLKEIMNAALDKVLEVLHLDAGGIHIADFDNRQVRLIAHRGVSKEYVDALECLAVDEQTLKTAVRKSRSGKFLLSLRTMVKDSRTTAKILSAIKKEKLNLRYATTVLLHAKGKTVGLMAVASRSPHQFSSQEKQLMIPIAQQIAFAVLNAQLYEKGQKDLAERKRIENKLKISLKEKEALIKEVHHRVKNNLQIISSLLNLQAAHIHDEHYKKLFQESQNRIKSMVLVHEKLYQSKDLTAINVRDYLNGLLRYLCNSYGVEQNKIAITTDIEDMPLNIETAIPCGLIINELVSNSLKHAFVEPSRDSRAEITIKFHLGRKNETILIISDNGVGFPDGLDFKKTESLGMQLVCALTEQLSGNIKLTRDKGTTFTITFKKGS